VRGRLNNGPVPDYQVARNNAEWPDHVLRANVTGALIASTAPTDVIDPACGDGSIVMAAHHLRAIQHATLFDISGPSVEILRERQQNRRNEDIPEDWRIERSSIEDALGDGSYDLIVLTEILEHLEDPDAILRLARQRAIRLVASSPEMRPGQIDDNPEHLWMFDGEGYEEMLRTAGWTGVQKTHLAFRSMYNFQIWVCS